MLTAVFEADLATVELHARKHLPDAIIVAVGRLTAVQSPKLDEMGPSALREIAEGYNLPLRGIVEKPPFARTQRTVSPAREAPARPLALPPAPEDRGRR